jgi:hypothetical protein
VAAAARRRIDASMVACLVTGVHDGNSYLSRWSRGRGNIDRGPLSRRQFVFFGFLLFRFFFKPFSVLQLVLRACLFISSFGLSAFSAVFVFYQFRSFLKI